MATVHANVEAPGPVSTGCTRICSAFNKDHLVVDPHCHQRCQADIYNCIEGTLPHEEHAGDRMKCIQEALLTRIKEDGGIITKLTYDVSPTFENFEELYQKDGRFDSRDLAVLKKIMAPGKGADGSALPGDKVSIVTAAFNEADQDGDGVVTEGEFNAYAKDTEGLAHGEYNGPDYPDMPDLLQQSNLRSPNLMKKVKEAQQAQEKQKEKHYGLTYFQHLLHLGLKVYREEEHKADPIAVLASQMYKAGQEGLKKKQESL